MKYTFKFLPMLLMLAISYAPVAEAKNNKNYTAKEFNQSNSKKFTPEIRDKVSGYLRAEYKGNGNNYEAKKCPPGLAKKNPLCMPPGQYKKYTVGQPLGNEIVIGGLPGALLRLLPPAPNNTYYGMVDNDVLLINAITKMVLDAVAY